MTNFTFLYEPLTLNFVKSICSLEVLKDGSTIMEYPHYLFKDIISYKGYFEMAIPFHIRDFDYRYNIYHLTKQRYEQVIFKIEKKELVTSCTCDSKKGSLCMHKVAAIIQLTKNYTYPNAILEFPSMLALQEEALQEYGFSMSDPEIDNYFDFKIEYQKWIAVPKDKSIVKINKNTVNLTSLYEGEVESITRYTQLVQEELSIGYVINSFEPDSPIFKINILVGLKPADKKNFTKKVKFYSDSVRDNDLIANFTENQTRINQLLSIITAYNQRFQYYHKDYLIEIAKNNLLFLKQFFRLAKNETVYISESEAAIKSKMTLVNFSDNPLNLSFELTEKTPLFDIKLILPPEINTFTKNFFSILTPENVLYLYESFEDYKVLEHFSNGNIKVNNTNKEEFWTKYYLPLSRKYKINSNLESVIQKENKDSFEMIIYLREINENLIIEPVAKYPQKELKLLFNENLSVLTDGQIIEYEKDTEKEKYYRTILKSLHPNFEYQESLGYYFIGMNSILENNWYFNFFDTLKTENITVYGMENIKSKRVYPYKASIKSNISSGIDWFGVSIVVEFGNEQVSLKEVQKAILRKENFVKLGDGSLGVLPEEWILQYGDLLRTSEVDKKGGIKISKMHFSLVDELFDLIDHDEIALEIEDKKRKLLSFDHIEKKEIPSGITASLRPYQESGYQWLNFLDSFKWGGCLADDMGLGKTLQMITFLQGKIKASPKDVNLIIVPTSLLFNWQREIEKFAPSINYLIHAGTNRTKKMDDFKSYQIVITTYGIITNDIQTLKDVKFGYVILDESQAIKNPDSQRYKSVCLLNSKNRMVMTGTPVENNTYDLYSQISFINPGLLGSVSHFKTCFSDPIDRYGDKEAATTLKKLIKPFILRRTKEQVAPDLPDKTEDIIICEMGTEQRRVYDAFKNTFKQQIVNKIDAEGLGKSSIMVLDALLKLRQICNSPALLNTNESYGNQSAKIEELVRHITSKTGDHKILVFSQFVQMLNLIKKEIEKLGISFEYLDGQTQSSKREKIVKNFQENSSIRVFLISLKAGGVGLNLTEADYVYLIDPWWNPAVEAQAIDRTHRIGQTKKVFAYKMICKDTIEEKVLQLQEKKKKIANEIISTEQSFYKQLEREDILELFD